MGRIKVGYLNFWKGVEPFLKSEFIDIMNQAGYDVDERLYDPTKEGCDIVFHSIFGSPIKKESLIGNPISILFIGENITEAKRNLYNIGNYSLTFQNDSDSNLYYPLWQITYSEWKKFRKNVVPSPKSKFCTFVVANPYCSWRNKIFLHLSSNYKKIDSCGPFLNTMNGFTLPRNLEEAIAFHNPYKFNLCFENATDICVDTAYITEKIMNAYIYGTVPIYWGCKDVTKWFNPNSFINCNGLEKDEILHLVKWYDEHDDAYQKMLSANPFIESENDWEEIRHQRFLDFIRHIYFDLSQ